MDAKALTHRLKPVLRPGSVAFKEGVGAGLCAGVGIGVGSVPVLTRERLDGRELIRRQRFVDRGKFFREEGIKFGFDITCLLYTSPSPRD